MEPEAAHRRVLRRTFIAAWIVSLVVAAGTHTLWPASFAQDRTLRRVLPHLTVGWVMFNRVDPTIATWDYRPAGRTELVSISELVETPSFGHGAARATLNAMMFPRFVAELCARSEAARDVVFVRQLYDVRAGLGPVSAEHYECSAGRLTRSR